MTTTTNPSIRPIPVRRSASSSCFALALGLAFAAPAPVPAQDLALPGSDLQIKGSAARYVAFSNGFSFPFGGVRHAGLWVHGCGYVTFGGLGQSSTSPDVSSFLRRQDEFDLLGGNARIAPFWADLAPDPAGEGRVRVLPGGAEDLRISWWNVQLVGQPASSVTCSLLLRKDGSFTCEYPLVRFAGATVLAGFSAGQPSTTGAEPTSDLTQYRGPIGNGSQAAIFEYFIGASCDLHGKTLEFAPVLPQSKKLSLAGDDASQIDLGFVFPFYGNRYRSVWVSSNGDLSFAGWSPLPMLQTNLHLLHDTARIVPLGLDMNPVAKGSIQVESFPDRVRIGWVGLPMTERTDSNTAHATLWQDGTIRFEYGAVSAPGTSSRIVVLGVCGGYPVCSGSETEVVFAGDQTYGTGQEAAIHQVLQGPGTFPLANRSLTFRPFTRASDLPLVASHVLGTTHRYVFPQGFVFPFAGLPRSECFVNSNGTVTFDGPCLDQTPTVPELLGGFPRIAALWNAFDPKPSWQSETGEGRIRVTSSSANDTLTFAWTLSEVRGFLQPPTVNELRLVLRRDGRFETSYGRVDAKSGITGYTTGGDFTSGGVVRRMLSAGGPKNGGGEPAVYQAFDGVEWKFDLANRTVPFGAVSGTLLAGTPSIGSSLPIQLQAGRAHAGLTHVLALAFSANVGIPLPGGLRFPLDADPLLSFSLAPNPLMAGFTGTLDEHGRSAWPSFAIPNSPGLAGLQLDAAFLTLDLGTGSFRAVSLPVLFELQPAVAAAANPCTLTLIKKQNGNAITVEVVVMNGKVPCPNQLVAAWLYDLDQGQRGPVAVLGFRTTDATGQVNFLANQALSIKRARVSVRTAGSCCGGLSASIEM